MKTIFAKDLIAPLAALIKHALVNVEKEACALMKKAAQTEPSALCKWALEKLNENNETAVKNNAFACQDCGQAVLFVRLGQDVHIEGNFDDALNNGVEQGYKAARKSVADPLTRRNTGSNTPAVIHYFVETGDKLEITYLAKGAGSENMSRVFMLTPSKGEKGIIDCVVQAVKDAGANPCPPLVLGIGIGGTMEKCALLSKLALTRSTGTPGSSKAAAEIEKKILAAVNETGIGAQGFGGGITALAVHVETCPTHIGMLPVAVNVQCHSVRHGKLVF